MTTRGIFSFMGVWNSFLCPLIVVRAAPLENVPAARDLVAHLIRLGHRRIGLLAIGEKNLRAEGCRLALQDAGIPYDPALVNVSNRVEPDLIALGRRQTEQLLASADRPTP